MAAMTIKKNIHRMVDMINDIKYLKSVENILSEKALADGYEMTNDEIKILEQRSADYKKNNKKLMTWEEVKEKIVSSHKKK
jgi:hypothetical protein